MRSLGVGIAVVDRAGCLVAVDDRFGELHRFDETTSIRPATGWHWQDQLRSSSCGLAAEEAERVGAAWSELTEAAGKGEVARRLVRLNDERILETVATAAADGAVVLTAIEVAGDARAADQAPPIRRLVHDINNVLGGILAGMHLCLSDVEANHPARDRLEAVNRGAIEMRTLLRQIQAQSGGRG